MSFDLVSAVKRVLAGCAVPSQSGITLLTPDGWGNYRALWTRDFAYMLHGAGDLIPTKQAKECIEYLLAGAREDGWIPDRVEPDGTARYTAGDEHFPALANLDTGPYLMMAADEYLSRLPIDEAKEQFLAWREGLARGLDCLPLDGSGLMVNDTTPPHSPYGFTDCVAKTGLLCMESLLLWSALGALAKWLTVCGLDAALAKEARKKIVFALPDTFTDTETGLLYSATGRCHQLDLWASCYAVYARFPLPDGQYERISRWLCGHYAEVVQRGQLRHLPAGEYWQDLFVDVAPGEYQNGAFWATPVEWLCAALMICDPELARGTLSDLTEDFAQRGIYECVNGDLLRLDTYVVSATNALAASRLPGMESR